MTPLTELAAHPLVHALGWTLVHFCWQGAMVVGMLWCVLGLLGGRSSQARYCASCSAMLLMAALPLLTFTRVALAEYQARSAGARMTLAIDVNLWLSAQPGSATAPWSARLAQSLDHSMPWLLVAWLLGAMFFVVRLNFGLVAAHRMRSVGVEPASEDLRYRFDVLRRRLGVTRAVRLLHSARLQVPTVIGWLRPAVLIPVSCLTGLSPDQIDAIFCHELAHISRHDYLVSVFQSLAEALLFYHPAVWWVSKQVRRERECCCDELAVASCGDALIYARALSYLEERRATLPEFALGATGGVLTMRIRRLLGCANDAAAPQFAALLLVALVVAIAGSSITTRVQAQKTMHPATFSAIAPAAASDAAAAAHSSTPDVAVEQRPSNALDVDQLHGAYKKWLEQEVHWLITDPEKQAFEHLSNDGERDRFIENFWQRRNPNPDSPENQYRDEYYARMAYANERFGSANQAGWHTDRGHVYLLYGKPQSIDSHPSGGTYQTRTGQRDMPYPFEVWHYGAALGGSGAMDVTFVDTCRCNEYNLTTDGTATTSPSGTREGFQAAPHLLAPVKMSVTPAQHAKPIRSTNAPAITAQRTTLMAEALPPPEPPQQVEAPDAAVRVSTSVMQGAILSRVYPIYPAIARAAHVQGVVVLSATISKQGTVSVIRPISGASMLIPSAVEAVKHWVYKPYLLNGEPTEVETTINVNYTFGDSPDPATDPPSTSASAILPSGPIDPNPHMADGATAPMVIYQVEPEFTEEARRAKVAGTVLLSLTIDQQGIPQNVHVVRRIGHGLDAKAVEAVQQYRFKPAMKDGNPVEEALNMEVNFQIF